jgi:RNA polymerase sigma-70 factor (ECF subfamily)
LVTAALVLGFVLSAAGRLLGSQSACSPGFDTVYDDYFDFVWRTCRRLGIPEASLDDAVQDVFIVVHRRLGDFRGHSSLKTWLFGVVLRVVQTHRRTASRRPAEPLGDYEPKCPKAGPAEATAKAQARAVLQRLLDELDEEKRVVFVLVEIEQMSCPEVAEAVSANINTVYSRLRAARKDFDAALARYRAQQEMRMPWTLKRNC